MAKKYKATKHALSYEKNLSSWKKGLKTQVIAKPSNLTSKSSRNGLILT